jgi:hypothetical protein
MAPPPSPPAHRAELPYERVGTRRADTKPDILTALGRIVAEEIGRVTKRLASIEGAETGAVSFPQRFGGSQDAPHRDPHRAGAGEEDSLAPRHAHRAAAASASA